MMSLTAILWAAVLWFHPFDSKVEIGERRFCPNCYHLGLKSTMIDAAWGSCTAMACAPASYDEEGNYVPSEPCNFCTAEYRCSRGHLNTERWKSF